jgi:hypothetical protein
MSAKQELFKKIWSFKDDPLGYVDYAFAWDKIPPLYGLEDWQREFLSSIREPGKYGVCSGHGIGKGAIVSMVIMWFASTRYNPSIVVTANTAEQLSAKTWRELSIWHRRAINSFWFDWTATRLSLKANPAAHFAHAIPWSVNRPEAVAGTHSEDVLFIMDEASFIPKEIWDVAYGARTTGRCWFIVLGNPTRRNTPFEACFTDPTWKTFTIDSRDCKHTNKIEIQGWVDRYGEDSDFIRVRVRGLFPKQGTDQYIDEADVDTAFGRKLHPGSYADAAKILSVDPARFGNNDTAIIKRQGLAAFDLQMLSKKDTIYVAGLVGNIIDDWEPDAVNIDSGNGGGIIDLLRANHYKINEIIAGSSSPDPRYLNLRMYMWHQMGLWLPQGSIPMDKPLKHGLITPQYHYTIKGKKVLEGKEEIIRRLGVVPLDAADALAQTFALPVRPRHPFGCKRKAKKWEPLDD